MADPGPPMEWEEFRTRPAAAGGIRVARGDGRPGEGVLRLPLDVGPHPLGVVLHGGCWTSMAGPDYMGHLAAALTRLGWATWTPAFLRSDEPGGSWPGMLTDVGRALDHARELAREHPLDLDRVVAVGHSSGAHLALWAASRGALPDVGEAGVLRGPAPLAIHGVVAFAPVVDLLDFHRRPDRECPASAVADLLGGEPEAHPERVAWADPASRLPLGVPQLLIAGTLDTTVPLAHPRTYAERARASGDAVSLHEISGAGHFEVIAPSLPTWGVISAALSFFLTGLRAPQGPAP